LNGLKYNAKTVLGLDKYTTNLVGGF